MSFYTRRIAWYTSDYVVEPQKVTANDEEPRSLSIKADKLKC